MKVLTMVLVLFAICGCSDPEFENCTVEIIDMNNDTLRVSGVYVEFEGGFDRWFNFPQDNVLIQKDLGSTGSAEWNYREFDIRKMTIIFENEVER